MRIINSLHSFLEFLNFSFKDRFKYVKASSQFLCSDKFAQVLVDNNVKQSSPLIPVAPYHHKIAQYHIASFITQEEQIIPSLIGAVYHGNHILFIINSSSNIESTLALFFNEITYEEALKDSKKAILKFEISEDFINTHYRDGFIESFKNTNSLRKMLDNVSFNNSDFQYFKEKLDEENYIKLLSTLRFENFDKDVNGTIATNISLVYEEIFNYAKKSPKRGKVFLSRFLTGVNNNIERTISTKELSEIFNSEEIKKFSQHLNTIHSEEDICIKELIFKNYDTPDSFVFSYYKNILAGLPKSMQNFIDKHHTSFLQASLGLHQYYISQKISSKYLNVAYICSPLYDDTPKINDRVLLKTLSEIISNLVKIPGFYDNLKDDISEEKIIELNQVYSSVKEMSDDIVGSNTSKYKIKKF